MDRVELLREVCRKEEESGCYGVYIDGIPVYRFVRYLVRVEAEKICGIETMEIKNSRHFKKMVTSAIVSTWQLLKLIVLNKSFDNVIISFPRVDRVNDVYLDKFTDPVIDLCSLKDYVIFDHGRGGEHVQPRIHQKDIVYTDIIHVVSTVYEKLFFRRFCKKHKTEIERLNCSIDYILGKKTDKEFLFRRMVESTAYTKIYIWLLHRIKAKRVMGPARDYMQYMFIAAHKNGMRAYELQHGVSYTETVLYSGREMPEIEPDLFFAFGDNKPNDVYGIDTQKIVNIGWAFQEYVRNNAKSVSYGEKDVLVVSEPEVSEKMVAVTDELAAAFPDSRFYFRPHPHEVLSAKQLKVLASHLNVTIHDTKINIMEALYGFNHVIGESSTALYEALSIGRKVGRVFMNGLVPMYLQSEDKDCSWEIHNVKDFERFLNEDISTKKSKSIYSKFDINKFNRYFS